jgi:predicted MFS family arabinose efflux permease
VRAVSQLGDGWFQAGLAGSVFFNPDRAASPLAIATAFAVLLVPYSALGPFVGVLLDRWSRRTVLFAANGLRAALVLPAATFVWHGQEGPLFVVLALAIIALNRFFLAGLSASQPHVVDEPRLVTANAFATTLGTVVFSVGLASAALTFRLVGTGFHLYAGVAAGAALGYATSAALTIGGFGVRDLGPDDDRRSRDSMASAIATNARGMVEGLRHLAARPGASAVMLVQALHRGCYGVLTLSTLLLYRNYFSSGADFSRSLAGLGAVVVAGGIGAIIASLITPPVARRIGGWRWVTVMMATLAAVVPALGLPYRQTLLVVAVGVVGLVTQGTKIIVDTALQVECADDFRGRVFSVNDTAFNLCFVGGLFIGALVLPVDGHAAAILVTIAGVYAAVAVWYAVVGGRHARRSGDDIQVARADA